MALYKDMAISTDYYLSFQIPKVSNKTCIFLDNKQGWN